MKKMEYWLMKYRIKMKYWFMRRIGKLLKWLFQFTSFDCFLFSEISNERYEPIEMVCGNKTIWHFQDGDIELAFKKDGIHLTAKNREEDNDAALDVKRIPSD